MHTVLCVQAEFLKQQTLSKLVKIWRSYSWMYAAHTI